MARLQVDRPFSPQNMVFLVWHGHCVRRSYQPFSINALFRRALLMHTVSKSVQRESAKRVQRSPLDLEDYVDRNRRQFGGGLTDFTVERYQQFLRSFPRPTKSILDVGCNEGSAARVLRAALPKAHLQGLDCVPERVAEARRWYDDVTEGFAHHLPFDDKSICVVIAGELIEHLSFEHAIQFLHESKRVLRPGGRLILTTPNPNYLKLRFTGRSVLDDVAHQSQFTPQEFNRCIQKAGMQLVAIRGSGRVSRVLGERFPALSLYGSYLAIAEK